MQDSAVSVAALADELRKVVNQAEALVNAIGEHGDEAMAALRDRVYATLETARARLAEMESDAHGAAQRFAVAAERYVIEHPWTAVAISASAGLILGSVVAGLLRDEDEAPAAGQTASK